MNKANINILSFCEIKSNINKLESSKMASSQKVQEFDMEGMKEFKKSLVCGKCKKPPRPGTKVYTSACTYECHIFVGDLEYIRFDCCKHCTRGHALKCSEGLTKFFSFFKLFKCINFINGCQEELDAKSLEAHERICLFREVTCPKLDCNAKFAFIGVEDHFFMRHDMVRMAPVLEFKGNLEDLKKNNFVLNCYRKPFYPQFYVKGNVLHFWVVGHGNQTEINSFKFRMQLFVEGRDLLIEDFVKSIDIEKNLLTSGQDGMMVHVKNLTQYYDVQSSEFKDQGYIEFKMKITSEKLDEIAKDENTESGVEDSGSEEK